MAKRYFEFKDANSHKFWEVSVSAKKVNIRYGKVGTDGQTSVKELHTPAAAKAHAEKQAVSKVKKGYKEASAKEIKKKLAVKKKMLNKVVKKIMLDLKGPDKKIKIRFTYKSWSAYDDEDENITKLLKTVYVSDDGDTWQDVAQVAANNWNWDDEEVINFEAKSKLCATENDFKKMEFLNSKGKWQVVPKEVENWYHEAKETSMR